MSFLSESFVSLRARRSARLVEVDALLAAQNHGLALAVERAQLLDDLGHTQAARGAFLDVLGHDSTHREALNAFGGLLDRTGFVSAARTAYARAVATHPADPTSHGNLATSLLDSGDIDGARRHFEIALRLDPDNSVAHQCLAILLLRLGDDRQAATHGRSGFRGGPTVWPYRGEGEPIPVLVVHSALGGNIPIERFIDDRTFAKSTIVAEFFTSELPPHAFVVNAIGDASRCRTALRAAAAVLKATVAPIVNAPQRVAATAREATATVLARLPGVIAPRTVAFPRSRLSAASAAAELAANGFAWPLIVRAAGFHAGQHCVLVERPQDLTRVLAALPGEELLAIQYIDVRGATDVNVRKYRVMIVDGQILPLHLAISSHWMVHYFRADMTERHDYRCEEAAFLTDMPGVLGPDAITALNAIAQRLGLDYGGIDFAFDTQRRIVVFEANATMLVPPSAAEHEPYRRAAVERVEAAVRKMLLTRAGAAAAAR